MHDMLGSLRLIKGGGDKGRLKASALPLPRVEPWSRIIREVPPTLPNLLQARRSRHNQAIEIRGERGDGRGTKPTHFMLSCPRCGTRKDCARHSLYTTSARCVTCRSCKRNSSSLKWHCSHGSPWHQCHSHREEGFWCGRAPAGRTQGSSKRTAPHIASACLLSKRRKLGSLGSDTQEVTTTINSAPSTEHFEPKKNPKERSRHGGRQPLKGDGKEGSWAWQAHCRALSRGNEVSPSPPDLGSSSSLASSTQNGARANLYGSLTSLPFKKPRLAKCKGQCPKIWTIDSYCPDCHG